MSSEGIEPSNLQVRNLTLYPIELRGLIFKAEDTGFEPVPPLRENGFRNRRFGPLSQPSKLNISVPGEGRTRNRWVRNPMLYPLSYGHV